MKFIARELETIDVNWENTDELLKEEAKIVLHLYEKGFIREFYFDEDKCAILIMESQSKSEALEILNFLPLVQRGMIKFEIKELKPYTGFSRLF